MSQILAPPLSSLAYNNSKTIQLIVSLFSLLEREDFTAYNTLIASYIIKFFFK